MFSTVLFYSSSGRIGVKKTLVEETSTHEHYILGSLHIPDAISTHATTPTPQKKTN